MQPPLFDLQGRIALVTGSRRGLGRTLARGLARAGATVVLNATDQVALDETVAQFRADGLVAHGYAFDVTNAAAVAAAVGAIEQEVGPLDILVNNAGVQIRGPLEDFDPADWDRLIDINLKGAFLVGQAVARGMIGRGRGKIINVCSMQSALARPTIAPYAASKGGLKMLTQAMATEWARHGLQVNGLGPGYFATDMTKALVEDETFSAWLCRRTPAGRWGDPEELVGPLVFLAGDASSFVNGHILYVDGGMSACV